MEVLEVAYVKQETIVKRSYKVEKKGKQGGFRRIMYQCMGYVIDLDVLLAPVRVIAVKKY